MKKIFLTRKEFRAHHKYYLDQVGLGQLKIVVMGGHPYGTSRSNFLDNSVLLSFPSRDDLDDVWVSD